MPTLLEGFALGNAAILTNVCLLPLYPGMVAFLAGTAARAGGRRASGWLGALVLAGVLTMMLLVGALLYGVQQSFGTALQWLLPLIYGLVIIMGALLLGGRNPFATLATGQIPVLKNPFATAYVYGLLLGPMTLPCTGPIVTSAFVVGAGSTGALAEGLLFFLSFGIGFGYPLVLLPLVALPVQRRLVGWLARHYRLLNRASGILLVAIGVFGLMTEWLPNVRRGFDLSPPAAAAYWLGVCALMVAVSLLTYRTAAAKRP